MRNDADFIHPNVSELVVISSQCAEHCFIFSQPAYLRRIIMGLLNPRQLIQLARCISVQEVLKIAEGYLNLDDAVIKNIIHDNFGNSEGIAKEIFQRWSYQHNTTDQLEVCSLQIV